MSQDNTPQSRYISGKSSLLWNIIDPDDPYDIRKSMIARLPDHNQNFMGNNLQIVCLMQAAQIERLNEFLEEYKIKYKEISRKDLDRHFYQVLIKQLTEKTESIGPLRIQNEKLRDFIKRQTEQLDHLTRTQKIPQDFQKQHNQLMVKYQGVLVELQNSRQSYKVLEQSVSKLSEENKELRMKYDRLDKQRLTELTQERQKYEVKIRERVSMEIKQVEHRYSNKIYQLESDNKLLRQQNQSKNHEISMLYSKCEGLQRALDQKQNTKVEGNQQKLQDLQKINQTLVVKISELQGIFVRYQNIEKQLREYQQRNSNIQQQRVYYERQYLSIKQEYERYREEIERERQNSDKMVEYENKVALLSSEVERLTFMLNNCRKDLEEEKKRYSNLNNQHQSKITMYNGYQIKITNYQRDLSQLEETNKNLRMRNDQLNRELTNISQANFRKFDQLQEELKRLQGLLKVKDEQIYNLEAKVRSVDYSSQEISTLKKAIEGKDSEIMILKSENNRITNRIRELQGDIKNKSELREELEKEVYISHQLRNENENFKGQLRQKGQNIQRISRELNEARRALQKYETDFQRGYLVSISKLQIEITKRVQEIRAKDRGQTDIQVRRVKEQFDRERAKMSGIIRELQSKVSLMVDQRRQLQQKLLRKDREIDVRVSENVSRIQLQYTSQIQDMTVNLKHLREQNEKLLGEKNRLRNNLAEMQRELVNKDREYGDRLRRSVGQMEELKRTNDQLHRQISILKQEISTYNQKIITIRKEVEQNTIQIYNTQVHDKDKIISSLERQLKIVREQYKNLQIQVENSQSTMTSYKERLLMVSSELERLNTILSKRNQDIDNLKLQLEESKRNSDKSLQKREMQIRQELRVSIERQLRISLERDIRYQVEKQMKDKNEKEIIPNLQNSLRVSIQRNLRVSIERELRVSLQNQIRPNIERELQQNLRITIERQLRINLEREIRTNLQQSMRISIERQVRGKLEREIGENIQRSLRVTIERELRVTLQKQIRSRLEIQIRRNIQNEMNREREKELGSYLNQINTLNITIKNLNAELEQKTSKNIGAQEQLQRLRLELENARRQIGHQNDVISGLQLRVSRANMSSEEKIKYQTEIQNLNTMVRELEELNAHTVAERDQLYKISHQYKDEISELRNRLQRQSGNIEEFKRRYQEQKMRQMERNRREWQNQRNNLIMEIEQHKKRLRSMQQSYKSQLHEWQIKYSKTSSISHEHEQLNRKFEQLNVITHELQQKNRYKDSQILNLQNRINELQTHSKNLSLYETRLKQTMDEIQRLNVVLRDKNRYSEQITTQMNNQIYRLKELVTIREEQSSQWEGKYIKLYNSYKQEEQIIKEQQQKVAVLQGEFDRLNERLRQTQMENKQLKIKLEEQSGLYEKNQQLSQQIDRLTIIINQLREQISQTRLRLTDQSALQKRIEQHLALMVVLFAEIETLRNRVTQTEKECENVRRSSLTPYRIDKTNIRRSIDVLK